MTRVPTSKDVAKAAGVSQPTVSRALAGHPQVSAATRERVRKAALELGYVPQESGRVLRSRRTRRIAVVCGPDDLLSPFRPQLVVPLHQALAAAGYRTTLIAESGDAAVLSQVTDGSVDGVLVTAARAGSAVPGQLAAHGVPHVLVDRLVPEAGHPTCAADNRQGAAEIATLVAGLGHREVALVLGPRRLRTSLDREAGFRSVLAAGRAVRTRVLRGGVDHAAGVAAARSLLGAAHRPTAILCANDTIALGVLHEARLRGVDVPGELTVTGFDDIPMAGWEPYALTTVRHDTGRMAAEAVRLLLSQLGPDVDGAAPESVVLRADLVLRQTHAPPPSPS
ncbi:LacI family DNA-binding transcriptional regulator [Phytohabitans sp. ZYX-F-186]|uniref:LacI family DNA-binding transcriptional regulator n=1 Tax=Phytohabitans maris TaxID=3071409 RepID=A0ABU0ZF73_9ACTN|nr:LacI family DNA-binding transcriptional regulator [Phytohabitans sp. ZYX-F-186]MDQ7904955.1 LacI family DNA-binding transcriptional regulator [Phytohabitans sp. ZYX-F-186]